MADRLARGCAGKKRLTPSEARKRAARVREETGEKVSPYRCPRCHAWHIGHVPSMESVEAIARAIRGLDVEQEEQG